MRTAPYNPIASAGLAIASYAQHDICTGKCVPLFISNCSRPLGAMVTFTRHYADQSIVFTQLVGSWVLATLLDLPKPTIIVGGSRLGCRLSLHSSSRLVQRSMERVATFSPQAVSLP